MNMTEELTDSIGVVIILYNPSEGDIEHVTHLAAKYKGAVVDNSTKLTFDSDQVGRMDYVPLYGNKGIATAQNIGIRKLLERSEIKYIVFLDQDSRIDLDYPVRITDEYVRIRNNKSNLAILGPTLINITTGEEYKSSIHKDAIEEQGFIVRRDVSSSGSVLSRDVIEKVGLNMDELFIDFVDFELCWRAASVGYLNGITHNVTIRHKVGKRELSLGRYKVIISQPTRYFYQYRNHIWLCRKHYVPLQWKVATGVKHFARLFYFPIFLRDGIACWKNMLKGIKAAFTTLPTN